MDRQAQIIEIFKDSVKDVLTKKEIIDLGKISYYHNTKKYVGETLSRMVKNGLIERVKIGSYKRTHRTVSNNGKIIIENPNQKQLFK